MRIVFLGTPPEAATALRALHAAGHDVAFVVTQPDRRRGRGGDTTPSPVKAAALDLGLTVHTPGKAAELLDDFRHSDAILGVVVAFGQLIPPAVLDALPHGFVNVHFSLLPRWRGAAPVERAVLAGDDETGVCLMQLEEGLDTGPVYAVERLPVTDADTAGDLRARLADLGARLLVDHLDAVPTSTPEPQHGEPTYARKLTPEEFRLDWSRPAAELARTVRAGNPAPGAWAEAGGRRLKVLRATAEGGGEELAPGTLLPGARVATGQGTLRLDEVQPEGRRPTPADEWIRGFRGDRVD